MEFTAEGIINEIRDRLRDAPSARTGEAITLSDLGPDRLLIKDGAGLGFVIAVDPVLGSIGGHLSVQAD